MPTLPIKTTMDINKYVVSAMKDNDVIDSVANTCNISSNILKGRISAVVEADKSIAMAVSSETPESATEISEQIIVQLNRKLSRLVAERTQADMSEIDHIMEIKSTQADSLKRVIQHIDSIVANEVSKSGTKKDQLIEHKILLEKNPDYIFASKLMEKYANDYGTEMSTQAEMQAQKFDQNYISIISMPDSSQAHIKTNKTKIILTVAFIAFICSLCLITFIDIIKQRKGNNAKS